jgi:hypothetical protein
MTKENTSILEKLGTIDYRIIYLLMTILVALPLAFPVGLPQAVSPNVIAYIDKLNSLKDGDVVLVSFSGYMTMLPDVEPIYIATWKMLQQKNVKLILLMTHVDSPAVIRQEFAKTGYDKVKVEGVDYTIMPYLDMSSDAAIISFTENMRSIFAKDIRGISLDDIPMMKNVNKATDLALYISADPEVSTRRYTLPYGVGQVSWGTATNILPFVPPFYDPKNGPVYGYVGGASQGAQMESYLISITGQAAFYAGEGTKTNDAKNLGVIGLVVIVAIGNISMLAKKKEGK